MRDAEPQGQVGLTPQTLPFLGAACAVGVGSIYYNQPLLVVMGQSVHRAESVMGLVAVATQVGYAAGMLISYPWAMLWNDVGS